MHTYNPTTLTRKQPLPYTGISQWISSPTQQVDSLLAALPLSEGERRAVRCLLCWQWNFTHPTLVKCMCFWSYGSNHTMVWGYHGTMYLCPIPHHMTVIPFSNPTAWLILCQQQWPERMWEMTTALLSFLAQLPRWLVQHRNCWVGKWGGGKLSNNHPHRDTAV